MNKIRVYELAKLLGKMKILKDCLLLAKLGCCLMSF
jgi:hypothetical protein